ncbi:MULTISPECIES: hypothetical protein [Niastella]|uniref:DUF4595 domain-containing protein n=1 Tax=Niastella soli TaxID=2821487 RepID=A0ABS3YW51_9BACT|nr:hypothetical protein [Niastella soli]MBO9201747.1 hypothetical protein [Niastella soli]
MKTTSFLVLALSALTISSCKKDKPALNEFKLSKISKYTHSNPPYRSYNEIYEFNYDGLNRVTEITYSEEDSINQQWITQNSGIQKFFYNGAAQQPYKSTYERKNSNSRETYYFYDNSNRLIADSTYSSNNYSLRKYNWVDDKLLTYGGPANKLTDSCILLNNNISMQFYHDYLLGHVQISFWYDAYINPLYTLNIRSAMPISVLEGFLSPGYSKNNVIGASYTNTIDNSSASKFEINITNIYQYNSVGLPVECQTGSGNNYALIKYYYTN